MYPEVFKAHVGHDTTPVLLTTIGVVPENRLWIYEIAVAPRERTFVKRFGNEEVAVDVAVMTPKVLEPAMRIDPVVKVVDAPLLLK